MLILNSPAKINLFLRILRKRPDGYHELASLFQAVDLCDKMHFEVAETDEFTCNDPSLPTDERNLVIKALRLFRGKTGLRTPLKIHLDKIIPQQAGLGGGSSNAATTLWACNQLLGKKISPEELSQWGAEIGSDVAFFLSKGTAYCTGRGEIVHNLDPLPSEKLWIVKPQLGLSTPQVYGRLNVADLPSLDPKMLLSDYLTGHPRYLNDLEGPAFAVLPELALIKEQLMAKGFSVVLLSGSGSSFFCMGPGNPPKELGLTAYAAAYVNRSDSIWY